MGSHFIRVLLLAAGLAFSADGALAAEVTYSNPVIAGDYPDPSVIRVGTEYWATATTSEWAPLFPILHSRDLVNWQHVGNVFPKRPDWAVGNFWAPEISEHRGRFYIYYVGRQRNGPLSIAVATADRPTGPWTDHGPLIGQAAGSIDAVTALDENGERYLIWKEDGNSRRQPTPIWAQKLSSDGAQLTGEMKELFRNDAPWEANLVEGPFVLRRGEWFYLFYSGAGCCGLGCNYALGAARSKKLLGPWEKNPSNPILAGNPQWKCPGHGSIVADEQGRDFLLYHAYHAQDSVYVGRQALLDQARWNEDGWPTINQGTGPSTNAASPFQATARHEERSFFDDFSTPELKPGWQWPQGQEPLVRMEAERGRLVLGPAPDQARDLIGGVAAIKTTAGNYTATTLVETESLPSGAMAGLAAFGDRENALGLSVGGGKLTVWRRQKNKHDELTTGVSLDATRLHLRMTATGGHRFRFAISEDGRTWKKVSEDVDIEGNYLPPWDRGVRVALTVGGAAGASAKFDWLRIEPTAAMVNSK